MDLSGNGKGLMSFEVGWDWESGVTNYHLCLFLKKVEVNSFLDI